MSTDNRQLLQRQLEQQAKLFTTSQDDAELIVSTLSTCSALLRAVENSMPKTILQPEFDSIFAGYLGLVGRVEGFYKNNSAYFDSEELKAQKMQSAISHLKEIEAEYQKDYAAFEQELDDYKSRLDADASILEHYKDRDVMPIETIFKEIRLKLEETESQIRLFIEAKQRKTMGIENAVKSNKKQ